jgi:hypothetical protein
MGDVCRANIDAHGLCANSRCALWQRAYTTTMRPTALAEDSSTLPRDPSLVRVARVAGLAYVLVITLPLASLVFVQPAWSRTSDAVEAARAIAAHQGLYRLSLLMDLAMYCGVIVLAASHHVLLRSVDARVSLGAMLLRSAEAIIGLVTVLAGVATIVLLADGPTIDLALARQIAVVSRVRVAAMDVVLVLLALGAAPFCALLARTAWVPRSLARFGLACYVAIGLGAVVNLASPRWAQWTMLAFVPGTLFELGVGFWLLASRPSVVDR